MDTGTTSNRKYEDRLSTAPPISKAIGSEKAITLIMARNNKLVVLLQHETSMNDRSANRYGVSKGATLYMIP